jgi:hypothetical protein
VTTETAKEREREREREMTGQHGNIQGAKINL